MKRNYISFLLLIVFIIYNINGLNTTNYNNYNNYKNNNNNCIYYTNKSVIIISNLNYCYILYPPNNMMGRWQVNFLGSYQASIYLYNGIIDFDNTNYYGYNIAAINDGNPIYSLTSIISIVNNMVMKNCICGPFTAKFIPTELNADKCNTTSIGSINDVELNYNNSCHLFRSIYSKKWNFRFDADFLKLNGYFIILSMSSLSPIFNTSCTIQSILNGDSSILVKFYPLFSNSKISLEYSNYVNTEFNIESYNAGTKQIPLHPLSFKNLKFDAPLFGSKWVISLSDLIFFNQDFLTFDTFCIQTNASTFESYTNFSMYYNFGNYFNQTYNFNSYLNIALPDLSCITITNSTDFVIRINSDCFITDDLSIGGQFKWIIFVNSQVDKANTFVGAITIDSVNILGPLSLTSNNYYAESNKSIFIYPLSTSLVIPIIYVSVIKVQGSCLDILSQSGSFNFRPYVYTCWNFDAAGILEISLSGNLILKNGDCLMVANFLYCSSGVFNATLNATTIDPNSPFYHISYIFGNNFQNTYSNFEDVTIYYEVKYLTSPFSMPIYIYICIILCVIVFLTVFYLLSKYNRRNFITADSSVYHKV